MSKQKILDAAVKLAETFGYRGVVKRQVAETLECAMGTINYHWGTMSALRSAIVHEAIRTGNRQIVLQAAAHRDLRRESMSHALRKQLDALNISLTA